ncbi:MAG: hypothetical protein RLZZ385_298 [Pseudomonadota bacterium]|jgi:uncharacterized secreted protein with C-terminal beta-propeller domain
MIVRDTHESNLCSIATSILCLSLLAGSGAVLAQTRITSGDGHAWVATDTAHRYAEVMLDSDVYHGSFTVPVATADVGKHGSLYLAGEVNGRWYMKVTDRWLPWDGWLGSLQAYASRPLQALETIPLFDNDRLPPGDFRIYGAYIAGSGLSVSAAPLTFTVQDIREGSLAAFASDEALETYLKEALAAGATDQKSYLFSRELATATADSGGARTSTTNLQVSGVDEGDTIKVNGDLLYALHACNENDGTVCLGVHRLDPATPSATTLDRVPLQGSKSEVRPESLYLDTERQLLVTLGGQNSFGYWLDIWGWTGNRTELGFYDVSNPGAVDAVELLTLDGSLVASRRIDETLYVVTRFTPSLDGFEPYPADKTAAEANQARLDKASLSDLLPRVTDGDGKVQDLIKGRDCYLPIDAVDKGRNPSIITVTAIPLATPTTFTSRCYLGGSETLYMTTDALYLATTQYDYQVEALDALVYQPDHTTAVHKFELLGGDIVYRGSGEVTGHLGWQEDKKSFRMGADGEYLTIVTSVGDTWRGDSSTQLTVLKSSMDHNRLDQVASIKGIGKPGEQLYAARFVGDRAYLVTFRLTDPLYVVDLSDPANPRITGELEIDGYSDYLHPVSEQLLVGIGKDAIPDDTGFGGGDARGAWYQGVKLSLFDVADPGNPREVDALVLGRRGTESAVLSDHHALSFLPATNGQPARLAIPVQLHDRTPSWEGFDASEPSAWYEHTHTALYAFEVDGQRLNLAGRIIGSDAELGGGSPPTVRIGWILPYRPGFADRSVLMDDAVFYVHQDRVIAARWGEFK